MQLSDNFLTTFRFLGSRIASPSGEREYINLEIFLLDSTLAFRNEDTRVNEALWCFFMKYGTYLSPHKISKLINKQHPYDPSILGAILSGIDSKFPKGGDFLNLKKYIKKSNSTVLYSFITEPKIKDEHFAKFNIIAPKFSTIEENHYLLPHAQVLKKCPELRYRTAGYTVAVADLRAAIEIHGKKSIYYFAKITNLTYAHTHECVKRYSLL